MDVPDVPCFMTRECCSCCCLNGRDRERSADKDERLVNEMEKKELVPLPISARLIERPRADDKAVDRTTSESLMSKTRWIIIVSRERSTKGEK